MVVTAVPEDATDAAAVVGAVTWASDNDAIATVAADGTITGVAAGTANITATSGTFTAAIKATVSDAE